jgi:adenine-specific DNA methylase
MRKPNNFVIENIFNNPPYYDNIGNSDLSDYILRLAAQIPEAHLS